MQGSILAQPNKAEMSSSRNCLLLLVIVSLLPSAASFQCCRSSLQLHKAIERTHLHSGSTEPSHNHADTKNSTHELKRKEFLSRVLTASTVSLALSTSVPQKVLADDEAAAQPAEEDGIAVYKTNSGLKYFELQPGTGPSPRYGQLCAIQYTGYLKLPTEPRPQKFDSNSFLIKHGNGRIIAGLDEGLHTMRAGGKRRLIIPPKLGYVQSGLGPIPELPWNRWKLNGLLEKMVDQRGGNLVFEVELKSVIDDEADQGYYEDGSPTPEEFERLRLNFQERNSAAATAREAENNIV